jgi:acyl dehydratase
MTPSRTLTEADVLLFAGLTGDYNELHTSEYFNQKHTQFGQRVVHGLMVLSTAHGLMFRTNIKDAGIAFAGIEEWKFVAPVFIGDTICADVLVIGGGGAACGAVLAAHDNQADTILVCKGRLGKSGATAFPVSEWAGFNVPDGAADPDDNPDEHLGDILTAGLGMADQRLARMLVDGAEAARDDLEKWGVNFVKDGGNIFR